MSKTEAEKADEQEEFALSLENLIADLAAKMKAAGLDEEQTPEQKLIGNQQENLNLLLQAARKFSPGSRWIVLNIFPTQDGTKEFHTLMGSNFRNDQATQVLRGYLAQRDANEDDEE
jgi:hypothetical protein